MFHFSFQIQNFKSISSKSRVQEMCKTWPMASQCVTCVTCCSVNIKVRCWAVPRRRWARHSVESRQADPWIRMQSLASKSVELVVRGSSARPNFEKIRFQQLNYLVELSLCYLTDASVPFNEMQIYAKYSFLQKSVKRVNEVKLPAFDDFTASDTKFERCTAVTWRVELGAIFQRPCNHQKIIHLLQIVYWLKVNF